MNNRKISDENRKLEEWRKFYLDKSRCAYKDEDKDTIFLHCWAYAWGQFDFVVKITNLGDA